VIDRILNDATAHAAATAGDFEACADRLNAIAVPARKGVEATRYTWVGLQKELGDLALPIRTKLSIARRQAEAAVLVAANPTAYAQAVGTAEAIGILFDSLASGSGPSFADDQTQSRLDSLAAILSSDEIAALKALGFHAAEVVTADECEAEWNANEAREALQAIRTLRQRWDSLAADVRSQIESGSLASADVVQTVQTLWGDA
jgi:hypothetical protein